MEKRAVFHRELIYCKRCYDIAKALRVLFVFCYFIRRNCTGKIRNGFFPAYHAEFYCEMREEYSGLLYLTLGYATFYLSANKVTYFFTSQVDLCHEYEGALLGFTLDLPYPLLGRKIHAQFSQRCSLERFRNLQTTMCFSVQSLHIRKFCRGHTPKLCGVPKLQYSR